MNSLMGLLTISVTLGVTYLLTVAIAKWKIKTNERISRNRNRRTDDSDSVRDPEFII